MKSKILVNFVASVENHLTVDVTADKPVPSFQEFFKAKSADRMHQFKWKKSKKVQQSDKEDVTIIHASLI